MRPSRDEYFISIAALVSTRATCFRRSVGCVLVNERGHVLSTGYNGRAKGEKHCNQSTGFNFLYGNGIDSSKPLTGQDTGRELIYGNVCEGARAESSTKLDACEAIHAEQNALLQCKDVWEIDTCYCTASPCITCVKLLMNTSCKRIVFIEPYAHDGPAKKLWGDREWVEVKPAYIIMPRVQQRVVG